MKVLDLGGACGHVFEGWFGSEADFQDQLHRGLLTCPLCGDGDISKRLSAPRLNLSRQADESLASQKKHQSVEQTTDQIASDVNGRTTQQHPEAQQALATLQAAWLEAVREVVAKTEDVGDRFVQEARRIHHGEAPARGIRGQATLQEAQVLVEEGIDLLPLPDLPLLKSTLQ